jgi:hypothetical protein
MPGLLLLIGGTVAAAYVVYLVGPPPKPAVLTQAQLDQIAAANAAAVAAAAANTAANMGPPQLFEPGFQGQPGASVSGTLVWRGEIAADGARIVYDVRGNPHHVYGV